MPAPSNSRPGSNESGTDGQSCCTARAANVKTGTHLCDDARLRAHVLRGIAGRSTPVSYGESGNVLYHRIGNAADTAHNHPCRQTGAQSRCGVSAVSLWESVFRPEGGTQRKPHLPLTATLLGAVGPVAQHCFARCEGSVPPCFKRQPTSRHGSSGLSFVLSF
jgi:hypothetical protein